MSARPGLRGGYRASDIPTAISSLRFREPSAFNTHLCRHQHRRPMRKTVSVQQRSAQCAIIASMSEIACGC